MEFLFYLFGTAVGYSIGQSIEARRGYERERLVQERSYIQGDSHGYARGRLTKQIDDSIEKMRNSIGDSN